MTRIIAGKRKGLTLHNPKDQSIRPTTDRVKEWIFSVLHDVNDLRLLDLFCGAGNLGIEGLSRGAESCVFVDRSKSAMKLTQKNLEEARLLESAEVKRADVFDYLNSTKSKFHLVFADPPYKFKRMCQLLESAENVLLNGGRIFIESGRTIETGVSPGLEFIREQSLGTTVITIFGK
ncbi:MAG: 16S rRNA (guanine(966)-N(2))-methyltransferase RsmD [Candidatus Marinimicrobia bacterium]|nr:16S rRNA (guanine(966)-N(2))-methyltransferase RsmD [Candidatus Neomarinimicrobiota bacterium]